MLPGLFGLFSSSGYPVPLNKQDKPNKPDRQERPDKLNLQQRAKPVAYRRSDVLAGTPMP
jgi:hypothetical protein